MCAILDNYDRVGLFFLQKKKSALLCTLIILRYILVDVF